MPPRREGAPAAPKMAPHGRACLFLADNSVLKASTLGLGYRSSKSLEDKDGDEMLEWFTTVKGVDEGDGWIKVGTRFLPAQLGGVAVMAAVRASAPAEEHPVVVVKCTKGHETNALQAKAGNCDACGKEVREGENVFDCRKCNWYLCSRCGLSQAKKAQPAVVQGNADHQNVTTCPKKHLLTRWGTQAGGKCDGCSRAIPVGEVVMDCRHCDWYLCDACCPQAQVKAEANVEEAAKQKMAVLHPTGNNGNRGRDAAAAAVAAAMPEPAEGWDRCPAGHALRSWSAKEGDCDSCGKHIKSKESVMDCRTCNWYICTMCSISRRGLASSTGGVSSKQGKPLNCSKGHELSFWETTAEGECDGCQKVFPRGKKVLDCRTCNWFLCAKCVLERRVWKTGRLPLCPLGHHLQKWASQKGGSCDSCGGRVLPGAVITDCRICDWYICQACFPLDGIDKRESFENTPSEIQKQAANDRDLCPRGHELVSKKAQAGVCDKCSGPVRAGEVVLDCSACNFYICTKCQSSGARPGRGLAS